MFSCTCGPGGEQDAHISTQGIVSALPQNGVEQGDQMSVSSILIILLVGRPPASGTVLSIRDTMT
jgi:hypothetical protein